ALLSDIAPTSLASTQLAPRVGLEPTTLRLTAGCSTIELSGSSSCSVVVGGRSSRKGSTVLGRVVGRLQDGPKFRGRFGGARRAPGSREREGHPPPKRRKMVGIVGCEASSA